MFDVADGGVEAHSQPRRLGSGGKGGIECWLQQTLHNQIDQVRSLQIKDTLNLMASYI